MLQEPTPAQNIGRSLVSDFSVSDVFRHVNARKPTSFVSSESHNVHKYEIILESPFSYIGDKIKGGIMATTSKVPYSIFLELKGQMVFINRSEEQKKTGTVRRQSKNLSTVEIKENRSFQNQLERKMTVNCKEDSNADLKLKLRTTKTLANADKPCEDNSEVFLNKSFRIFDFSYGKTHFVCPMFFPFSIELPEDLPSNISLSLFNDLLSEIDYIVEDEMINDLKIKYELSVVIKYSKNSALTHEVEKFTRELIIVSKGTEGHEVVHQEQITPVVSQYSLIARLFKLCSPSETVFSKLSSSVLKFNDALNSRVSIVSLLSENILKRTEYSVLQVQLKETISDKKRQFETTNVIMEENYPVRTRYLINVEMDSIKEFNPDTSLKGFQIRHEIVGKLRNVTDGDSEDDREVFKFPIVLEIRLNEVTGTMNQIKEEGPNVPENCLIMPYSRLRA